MTRHDPARPQATRGQVGPFVALVCAGATAGGVLMLLAALPGHAAARAERTSVEVEPVRREEVAKVWEQVHALAARIEGIDGATAFREAKRLGIVDAVRKHRPRLRQESVRRLSVAIVREARRHRLDPLFLTAVARIESGFDPNATSHKGARGLLQVMPDTGRELLEARGEEMGDPTTLYDIETNVSLGAEYLAGLLKRFRSERNALLAYNRGPRGAREALKSPDARLMLDGYPRAVLTEKARLLANARRRDASDRYRL